MEEHSETSNVEESNTLQESTTLDSHNSQEEDLRPSLLEDESDASNNEASPEEVVDQENSTLP